MSNELSPQERARAKAAYRMPEPSLGPCVWRNDPHSEPVAGVITQIGSRSVQLTVFAPDNRGGLPKDGVRHISDPELGDHPGYEGGCWDFGCDHNGIESLAVFVGDLIERVAALEKELSKLKSDVGA